MYWETLMQPFNPMRKKHRETSEKAVQLTVDLSESLSSFELNEQLNGVDIVCTILALNDALEDAHQFSDKLIARGKTLNELVEALKVIILEQEIKLKSYE